MCHYSFRFCCRQRVSRLEDCRARHFLERIVDSRSSKAFEVTARDYGQEAMCFAVSTAIRLLPFICIEVLMWSFDVNVSGAHGQHAMYIIIDQ